MIKSVGSKFFQRKDSSKNLIKIVLFLYDNQFSSMKKICSFDGNKNYDTIKNYVRYLLENKIIFKVPFWQGEAFYVKVDGDQVLKTQVNYHTTKHQVSLKINKIMSDYPQLKEIISKYGIVDFTKITKSNIPKKPFETVGLDTGCTVVIKYLNLIILATKVMILEEKIAKKNHFLDSQLVKREARICEMWLDLESFLNNDFGKTTVDEDFTCMAKTSQIYYDYKLYHDYFAHLTHSKTSFSEFVKALTQIKLGYKQEYSDSSGLSMPAVSKLVRKFIDISGRIDIRYLSDMRRIEKASKARFHEEDIEDLFYLDLFSDDLNLTRWEDDPKSKIEKEKTCKIIKQLFPKMQVL